MTTDPAKRTDRTARKATAEQVMELSRNLPLTRSVPGRAVENATPGQLGFLAALFTAENASRAESKRNRLPGQAGFPQSKELDGYDWSMAAFPADWGREQLVSLEFIDHAEDLVLHGRRGHARRTSPRHRHRHPRLQAGHTGQVLHRLRPDHAPAQGQGRQQARPGAQGHRQGRPARHRTGPDTCPSTSTAPDSCPRIIADSHGKEKHHLHLEPRVRPVGRRVRRRRHGRRGHRPHRPPWPHHPIPRRILPKHPLTHEITNKQRKPTNRPYRPT